MRIIIGADCVCTKENENSFVTGDVKELIGEDLNSILQEANYRIINCEIPLTESVKPIPKCGANLRASTKAINGYKALGVDLAILANNHIMDYGVQGLHSTVSILKENSIDYVGAGDTIQEACQVKIINLEGKKIGVYACAEHEFSIATEEKAGANPFDPLFSLDDIQNAKSQCDYLIVFYHGGKEHYRYPSPNLQKTCRRIADKGANLIVCQHSHCVGCEEKYNNATIIYGQGNFIFQSRQNEFWNSGVLIAVDNLKDINYIPVKSDDGHVRMAKSLDGERILQDFFARSEKIYDKSFVSNEYKRFASSMLNNYLYHLNGDDSKFFYVLNRLSRNVLKRWIIRKRYSRDAKLFIRNYIECEAHRELLINGLISEDM